MYKSSIGEHLRHILDLFFALAKQPDIGVVDYDHRRRGAPVETDLLVGISELQEIKSMVRSIENRSNLMSLSPSCQKQRSLLK